MTNNMAVSVEGLWKKYGAPSLEFSYIFKHWIGIARSKNSSIAPQSLDTIWALRNISFEVQKGETLGVIGRNGSGKSTLLKVLAGTTPPTYGHVELHGRMFSMIELNAGMNPELTGRENVRLLGAIMGFSESEIKKHIPGIEEFCELGEWFERPVRTYSSGMLARLGFAVAVNVDAEVLLIDEVLAVGDIAFQKKCINAITRLRGEGVTTIFVSHSPYQIERMCDRALMLNNGSLVEIASPELVIPIYLEMVAESSKKNSSLRNDLRTGTGDLRVTEIEFLDEYGNKVLEGFSGKPLTIRLHYDATVMVREPHVSIRFFDQQNTEIICLNSTADKKGGELIGKGYFDCKISYLPVVPKFYTLQIKISDGALLLDVLHNAGEIEVKGSSRVMVETAGRGIVYAPANWEIKQLTDDQVLFSKISDPKRS